MIKNEFWGLVNFNRWVKSPSGRSSRRFIVKRGLFIIVHRNTGQFILRTSNNVSDDVDKEINNILNKKCKNKKFLKLFEFDDQMEILEFKGTSKEVKNAIATIKHNLPEYYNYLWNK